MRLTKVFILLCSVLVFAACSSDDDNNNEQRIQDEQDLYDQYVTAEMEAAILKLDMPVYRGINPPNIEGYYKMIPILSATTNILENSYIGTRWDTDYKFNFYDQNNFFVDVLGYEVTKETDVLRTEHNGNGTFITGENDKFSIFMEEESTSGIYTSKVLTILSGEVVRTQSKITGIKNFRYAFIMKDRGGNTSVIAVGQGRVFKDDEVAAITKEKFETLTKSASLKSDSSNSDMSLMSVFE